VAGIVTTIIDPDELAWANERWLAAVQACLGRISEPVQAVWIQFEDDGDMTIHVRLSELNEELAEDVDRIGVEAVAYVPPDYASRIGTQIHVGEARPDVDQRRYRWVYLSKQ
jgi:hypothetical protein